MTLSWKKVVGVVAMIGVMGVAIYEYWQHVTTQAKALEQQRVDIINYRHFGSKLNCVNPVLKVENLICSSEALLALELQHAVAYTNSSLWRKRNSIGKTDDELCPKDCLINLEALHQRWIYEVRNRCDDEACLTTAIVERIAQLNGQEEPLPSFRYSRPPKSAMCDDMLAILNATAREQLGACASYDFSGSAFSSVSTKLTSEHWEIFERYNYAKQGDKSKTFEQVWPEIKADYEAGARELYGVKVSTEEQSDGYWLYEVRHPAAKCQTSPFASDDQRSNMWTRRYYDFKELSPSGKLLDANQNGWHSTVAAPSLGAQGSLYTGQLLNYAGEWYVLDHDAMRDMNALQGTYLKPWIEIERVQADIDSKTIIGRDNVCNYWYNY